MTGLVWPLSASVGGGPILLDNGTVPGKVIHANPVDSGGNDLIQNILVGNPNFIQVSLYVATVGPNAPAPTDHSQMIRIDVPPTAEGTDVRIFYTPFVIAPGYTYYLSCPMPTDQGHVAPYLYGYLERYSTAPYTGYGGLRTATAIALSDILANTWVTVPMQTGSLSIPVNVTQDPANDQLSLGVSGIWAATAYVTLEFAKSSQDRIFYLRFWNNTKGVEASSSPFPMYIEQQATGGSWAIPAIPLDVVQDNVGDGLSLQIGGAVGAFTAIQLDKAGFNVFKIG